MITALFAAAVACGNPGQPLCHAKVGSAVLVYGTASVDVEVCNRDANRPDLTVCIAGAERRIRLFMPYPPCGTPEAKAAPRCAEWKIGRP